MNQWIGHGFAKEITEAKARQSGLVVSGFVVYGSKPWVVIDYISQNEYLTTRKFRMDTLGDLAPQLKPEDALLRADVQDAYYHLRRCDHNKLLFRISGRFFRPLALKCGLSAATYFGPARSSTKTLRRQLIFSGPAVHPQRTQLLGRQTQSTASSLRLGTHPFSYRPDPTLTDNFLYKPSPRPLGSHHPWHPPF
jgi:hypothetical protein